MNTNKLKLLAGIVYLILLLPSTSEAYFTTGQTATRINDETILFTITYQFGFLGRELYMPIMAMRGSHSDSNAPHLEYELINQDGSTSTLGTSYSVALTSDEDAVVRDSQYYLPLKKSAEFTLITLLHVPRAEQTKDLDLSLLVTSLPFTMVKDGTPIPAQLNPSELQYYKTPSILLAPQD
ncbi:hypothetical protein H6785_03605 [Candidatus Nomurabacteria bacterium]|nr:hypothetical protein [Candidatus Nomurabacteria bacterium]